MVTPPGPILLTFFASHGHGGCPVSGPALRPGLFSFMAPWRLGRMENGAIKDQRVRVNDQIRISPIRLIDADGEQLGVVALEEAKERAAEAGLDLVEVAPGARPPVCRLMDYGKYKYEEARKAREAKKKQHTVQVKEVKYRPGIEDHDYEFKTRHVRRFLEDGDKVKVTMMFRGRQLSHPELGLEVLERVVEDVADLGKVESQPTREGRSMIMMLSPLKGR
jgi:translation initiation factor IF-3